MDRLFETPSLEFVPYGLADCVKDLTSRRASLVHARGKALAVKKLTKARQRRKLIHSAKISLRKIRKERARTALIKKGLEAVLGAKLFDFVRRSANRLKVPIDRFHRDLLSGRLGTFDMLA